MTERAPVTYREAGVDIDAGDALVERIKPLCKRTHAPRSAGRHRRLWRADRLPPSATAARAGLGHRRRRHQAQARLRPGRHDTVGIDLVAMCVNDVLVQGAEPLFFLDYFATGKLDVDVAERVIKGIARAANRRAAR